MISTAAAHVLRFFGSAPRLVGDLHDPGIASNNPVIWFKLLLSQLSEYDSQIKESLDDDRFNKTLIRCYIGLSKSNESYHWLSLDLVFARLLFTTLADVSELMT